VQVQIYLASSSPLAPGPVGWPERSRRGFWRGVTDMSNAEQAAAIVRELQDTGFAAISNVQAARFVTRIDVWRTPGAPLSLAVRLGGTADRAWARLTQPDARGSVVLCPSAGREPLAFGR
jgi:hypothetical protein